MVLAARKTPIIEKTEELCQTILEQDSFREIRRKLEAFGQDAGAQSMYEALCEKQDVLQDKQRQGQALSDEEIDEFEKSRDALYAHPIAAGYLEAQQQMHKVQDTVTKYVAKTFELGRLPSESDLRSGCCGGGGGGGGGGGCGCHH